MSNSSNRFSLYQQYPDTSYSNVKKALEKFGYSLLSDNDEIAYFKKNLQNESELSVEIPKIDYIPKLNICLIAEHNNLGNKFKKELWALSE